MKEEKLLEIKKTEDVITLHIGNIEISEIPLILTYLEMMKNTLLKDYEKTNILCSSTRLKRKLFKK